MIFVREEMASLRPRKKGRASHGISFLDAKLHKQNHRFKHGWNLVADVLGTWLNSV